MIILLCFVGILLIRLVTIQSILWNPVIEANHYLYSRKNSFHEISNNVTIMKGESSMESLSSIFLEDQSNSISTNNKSSTIQTRENSNLLFFSPDVHDGTMTDLSVSLTTYHHSIFFFNTKCAVPAYTGLRSHTLTDQQFLNLKDKSSRILFPKKEICKQARLHVYNMDYVKELWELFSKNAVFRSVDAIICMFYPSQCQNYLVFNKTTVFVPAHRLFIKRCRQGEVDVLLKWMFSQPRASVIVMAAGRYDAEYINYYTGREIPYLIASTVLMYSPPELYSPELDEYLFAPFKKRKIDEIILKNLTKACVDVSYSCPIVRIRDKFRKHFTYADINKFKAVVVFPYAVLSYYLADLVTTAIPMFVPSPSFMVKYKLGYDMKTSDPSYCGKKFVEPPRHPNSKHPYSPEDSSSEASEYWLKFASFYTPCSIQFNSYPHLVQLMKSTNLSSVYECNKNVRQYILKHNREQWMNLFSQIERGRRFPKSINDSLTWYNEKTFF